MDAASQRSAAIKAIMSDTTLTPQDKQKKMLELNKVATSSVASTVTSSSKPTSTNNQQRNPAAVNGGSSNGQNGTANAEDSRAAKIQKIIKDSSLTAFERQKKIQEIMKGPVAAAATTNGTADAPISNGASNMNGNREAIQAIVSRDSLDPQMKQEKIKGVMATGGESTPTTGAAAGNSNNNNNTVVRQQFVETLMKDTTLTPQEKQKRIREEITQPSPSEAIQTIVSRNSLDPQMKQEKIQEVIAASSRNVVITTTTTTTSSTTSSKTNINTSTTPTSDRQLFVQTLMQDKTLTPHEKQKRIREKLNEPSSQRIAAATTTTTLETPSSKKKDIDPSSAKEELLRRSFGASAQAVEALKQQAALKKEESESEETKKAADQKMMEVKTAVTPSSEAEKELLRRSFGASAQVVEALKEQVSTKKEEEEKEKARSRLSYGSPTAAIAAIRSGRPAENDNGDYDEEYDFSHIRDVDEKQASKPEPKGTRISQISKVVPKPSKPTKDAAAASNKKQQPEKAPAPNKPKNPASTKAQPTTKPTATTGVSKSNAKTTPATTTATAPPPKSPTATKKATSAPEPPKDTTSKGGGGTKSGGKTDDLLPSMKLPPKPATAATRNSIQGSKRRFDENSKEISQKPETAKDIKKDSSAAVPVPASEAKPADVNNNTRSINVGADAPAKGILKSDTPAQSSAEAGCCIIL